MSRRELPVASGMKLVVSKVDGGFALKDITVAGKPLVDSEEYTILLTDGMADVLQGMEPGEKLTPLAGTNLSRAWTKAMSIKAQPAEPEDYMELQK